MILHKMKTQLGSHKLHLYMQSIEYLQLLPQVIAAHETLLVLLSEVYRDYVISRNLVLDYIVSMCADDSSITSDR